jgi:hypothetical protein
MLQVSNPSLFPDPGEVEFFEEPVIQASVITPTEYMGDIMMLCKDRRGEHVSMDYLDQSKVPFCMYVYMCMGNIMMLCKDRRGEHVSMDYLDQSKVLFCAFLYVCACVYGQYYDVVRGQARRVCFHGLLVPIQGVYGSDSDSNSVYSPSTTQNMIDNISPNGRLLFCDSGLDQVCSTPRRNCSWLLRWIKERF